MKAATYLGAHSSVFVRFMNKSVIAEELLCCLELVITTRGQDIFNAINNFFFLFCTVFVKTCVTVCTNAARVMVRNSLGFFRTL